VSKQDTHFINVFSMVIALLVAIAIALFALARVVASHTQDKQILTEADYYKNVEERVRLFARVAVAGKDNSALAIQAPADAAPAAPEQHRQQQADAADDHQDHTDTDRPLRDSEHRQALLTGALEVSN